MTILPSEPTAPPADIVVTTESPQSISVKWGTVPASNRNGIITGYRVLYQALPNGTSFTKTIGVIGEGGEESRLTTLEKLNEFTNYSISVLAFTVKGDGPASDAMIVQTEEDSK